MTCYSNPCCAMLLYSLLWDAWLCYVVVRYAMLWSAKLSCALLKLAGSTTLCYATPSYAMLCCAMLCCAMLCYATLRFAMFCLFWSAFPSFAWLCCSLPCHEKTRCNLARKLVTKFWEIQVLVPDRNLSKVAKMLIFMYFFANCCRENTAEPQILTSTL